MAEKSAFQSSQFLTAPDPSERFSDDDVCARMNTLLPSLERNESLAKQYYEALKKQKRSKTEEEAWFWLSDCYTQAKALANPASGPSDYHWASHYLDESMGKVSRRVPKKETNTVLSSARDDVVGTSSVARGLAFARLSLWHGGLIDSGPFEDGPEFFKIGANRARLSSISDRATMERSHYWDERLAQAAANKAKAKQTAASSATASSSRSIAR